MRELIQNHHLSHPAELLLQFQSKPFHYSEPVATLGLDRLQTHIQRWIMPNDPGPLVRKPSLGIRSDFEIEM